MQIIALINAIAGLLIAALSLPLILGKIPPNPWYGFRTPRTLGDPAVWYPANAYAGRWLLATGAIIALAAIALLFAPAISVETYSYTMLAVTLITVGVSVLQSFRYLSRLPK